METLFDLISKALNSYLSLDESSHLHLKRLQGKTITIELLPLHLIFQCQFTENGIRLNRGEIFIADTVIRGTPLNLLNVMIAKNSRLKFFADDVQIEGDAAIGQQVIKLFDDLDIDWEEQLSACIGDAPAFKTTHGVKNALAKLKQFASRLQQDTTEYLQEEARFLPTREIMQIYFDEIDDLRMHADRVEARFNYLKKTLLSEDAS